MSHVSPSYHSRVIDETQARGRPQDRSLESLMANRAAGAMVTLGS